jgi:hypothetical protein
VFERKLGRTGHRLRQDVEKAELIDKFRHLLFHVWDYTTDIVTNTLRFGFSILTPVFNFLVRQIFLANFLLN